MPAKYVTHNKHMLLTDKRQAEAVATGEREQIQEHMDQPFLSSGHPLTVQIAACQWIHEKLNCSKNICLTQMSNFSLDDLMYVGLGLDH